MTLFELDRHLDNAGYKYLHTSTLAGYVSRKKEFEVTPYVGRFGIGVKVLIPRHDSSRYVYCMYYILDCSKLDNDIILPEKVLCEFKNGNKIEYTIKAYKIGKYDVIFKMYDGSYTIISKKSLKTITTEEVARICDLNYSDQ